MISRRARALALHLLPVVAVLAPSAAHARVVITHTVAEPVTAASPCTPEPQDAIYNNTAFDPAQFTDFFNSQNLPSSADHVKDLRAGATSDFCVGYALTPDYSPLVRSGNYHTSGSDPLDPETDPVSGDDQNDITVTLPDGYAGALANVPTCSAADFGIDAGRWYESHPIADPWPNEAEAAACAANTQVGDAHVRVSTDVLDVETIIGTNRLSAAGKCGTNVNSPTVCTKRSWIYNLEPGPNELGRLGVQIYVPTGMYTPTKFEVSLRLAPDGSGRVQAVVKNAPRFSNYDSPDLYVESVAMQMWGLQSEHPSMVADFSQSATSCAAAHADVDVTTHGGPATFDPTTFFVLPDPQSYVPSVSHQASPGYTLTGCDQVPFSPSVDVSTTEHRPGVPTGVDVSVNVDQAKVAGILPSTLKNAAVTLPAGLEIGGQVASGANGLKLCSAAQFAKADPTTPAACPAATRAGSVAITSPLITRQLTGDVFLGPQHAVGELPDLYLEATIAGATAPDAPRIKLVGTTTIGADGRLTATFLNNPQLRFSQLKLSFPGGDHALFVTPQRCGTHQGAADLTPWSGQAVATVTSSLTINEQCSGAAAPKLAVSAPDAQAGKKTSSRIVISRDPSAPWMAGVTAHLPSGFLADISSSGECPAAKAATGDCSADSRIGSVTTWAGAGSAPFQIAGDMYLSERKGSDVAGAVIVVNAKVGDLDLGKVIVPGRILLRPTDAGLDFITDVPLRVHGVALQLQKVQVDLDRPNFALNPSACGPLDASVELTDDQGAKTNGSTTASYTGCKSLPFAPKMKAILTGDNTPGGHPGMYVILTSPEGESGMKSAAVTLPEGVTTDGLNIKNACSPAAFAASSCPASTRIGSATANVSIIPEAITGDIFLVTVAGKALPGLGLDFKGRYAQRVLGNTTTDKQSRIVTTFPAIPDLPLRKLVIDVASGAKAPLLMSENEPCANGSSWQGIFTAQGGQSSTSTTGLQCAATPKTTLSTKAGLSFRLFDFGTRKLKYLKLSLPKGWSFNAKAAKKVDGTWARLTGGAGTVKLTKTSVFVNATGEPTDVRFKIAGSAIRHPKSVKKGTKIKVPLRLAFTDGAIQEQQLTLTAK